jgi:elongation factor 1-beta
MSYDYGFDELSVALSYAILIGGGASAPTSSSKAAPAAPVKAAEAPKAAAKADDFDDMFGGGDDDDDVDGETAEEKAATKARQERMALAKKLKEEKDAKEGKKAKVKEAEKSLIVLEVKPWEADTDLVAVWNKIKEYSQEGLTWGETYKLEPVAYGIQKLVMTVSIVDSLVLLDDITGQSNFFFITGVWDIKSHSISLFLMCVFVHLFQIILRHWKSGSSP